MELQLIFHESFVLKIPCRRFYSILFSSSMSGNVFLKISYDAMLNNNDPTLSYHA